MDIKRSIEILSLIAGIILAAQTIHGRRETGPPLAREVDNIPTIAPTNYLGDAAVQAKIQAAINRGPYRDYATWYPGKGGGL